MADKAVDLQVPISLIKQMLKEVFAAGKHPHSELLAKIIVNNLDTTEMGLSQTIMAFMGIEETTKWVVGDETMINPKDIYAWGVDKDLMKSEGMLHKGHIKGTIEEINMHKKRGVTFKYEGASKDSTTGEIKRKIENDTVRLADLKSDEDLILKRPDIASMI